LRSQMDLDFDLTITNPKEFIKMLKGLKGRAIIRTQQFLELAQAQLSFVAGTDETINPDLCDKRLIVEAINEYDAKLYAKSNSSATQEVQEYDAYDVEEEDEAKPAAAKQPTTEEEDKPPAAKKPKADESPAGACAGYHKSLKPSSSAEQSTDKLLTGIADYGEKYASRFGKLDDYEDDSFHSAAYYIFILYKTCEYVVTHFNIFYV
jgi:hypothetical protein